MKKVYVQIINTNNGIYQTGMIEEPVREGFEVRNALKHFLYGEVEFLSEQAINNSIIKSGRVKGTDIVVNVTVI